MATSVELIEFEPGAEHEVVAAMDELAGGGGWLTLDPAIDERFPPPEPSVFGRLVSGRGPAVPRGTWVPADLQRRRPEPVSVGILHGTGAKAVDRLVDKDVPIPDRWRLVEDHSKRGIVLWVPIDIDHLDTLRWTCRAATALTRIPLTGRWRVAVHRR